MLYNIVLVSAIYEHESAIGIRISFPSWTSLLPPTPSHPIPPHPTPLGCHKALDLSSLYVPNLIRKFSSCSQLSKMSAVSFLMFLVNLKKFLFIPSLLRVFIRNECWILWNAFSVSLDMIMWLFFLTS